MGGAPSGPAPTPDEMDAMHAEGIRAFLEGTARTAGLGGQPLAFELDGGTKVFRLSCAVTDWEYAPGKVAEAFAFNGVVPGPEIRVTEGDRVRIEVTNDGLPQSTAVHFHGVLTPNAMDGMPFVTQPPIRPGETFAYEFDVREGNAGTHMYHSHHNAAEQVTKGLLGPFVIEPRDPASRPAFDREHTILMSDGGGAGFTVNGKSFPATRPLAARLGERVLLRYVNGGQMPHPMHLHGMAQQVVALDGYLLDQPFRRDTVSVDPGQRVEVIVEASEPGFWPLHCHVLYHAESAHGMFGMVSALVVEE